MILDSSAVVALVPREPGHDTVPEHMAGASQLAIGAATLLEATMVPSARLGEDARPRLCTGELFTRTDCPIVPVR